LPGGNLKVDIFSVGGQGNFTEKDPPASLYSFHVSLDALGSHPASQPQTRTVNALFMNFKWTRPLSKIIKP
jgi:hypothetical protein